MTDLPADLTFHVEPDPPAFEAGDRVDVLTSDGVGRFIVTSAEPWQDDDGSEGERVHFVPAPLEDS